MSSNLHHSPPGVNGGAHPIQPHEERFSDLPGADCARLGRLYLNGPGALVCSPEERQAIERACVLCERSPAVAAYIESLGLEPWERFTPDHAAKAEELAREERAPGGSVAASEFFAHSWPVRRALVGEWLGEGSLGMVYAFRGRGKTWLAYDLALSVALGSQGGDFLGWAIEGEGRPVLYVDGEMMPSEIRERFSALLEGRGVGLPSGLRLLSRMAAPGEPGALLSSLSTPEGRAQVERAARGCALVILDNARTLGLGGAEENESAQWLAAQEWLLSLKRLGCAVLFVHHAGKGGQQRGTSAREDACDYVLGLHPPELSPGEERASGARCVVRFEKSRGATLAGLGARDARLLPGERGGVVWGWEPVEEGFSNQPQPKPKGAHIDRAKLGEYRRLLGEGVSVRIAADSVGVPRSTLLRWDKATPADEPHHEEGFSRPTPEGRPTVPLSHPLKGGVGHGTRDAVSRSDCPTVQKGQWDNGTDYKNGGLAITGGASVPRMGHEEGFSAGDVRKSQNLPPTEEGFSNAPPQPTKSASPVPRRGGPIPPGLAPIVTLKPKGPPGAGGRP